MFFVCGPARSGTSLLSSLLNSHPLIGCAQDTGLYTSIKFGYSQIVADSLPDMQITSDLKVGDFGEDIFSLSSFLDFSQPPFKPEVLSEITSTPLHEVLSSQTITAKVFGTSVCQYLLKLYLCDFQIDDPRKDRALGFEYLKCLS